jgi:hypothetical protein
VRLLSDCQGRCCCRLDSCFPDLASKRLRCTLWPPFLVVDTVDAAIALFENDRSRPQRSGQSNKVQELRPIPARVFALGYACERDYGIVV